MPTQPIQFYNRYTQSVETESVYGDKFLQWVYENPLGRLTKELVVKRAFFSKWYGWRMDMSKSASKVRPFIENYGLDAAEFLESVESFKTFNEFFYRKLKPTARPMSAEAGAVVFPADGRHLGFEDASAISRVFVKGQKFDIAGLVGNAELGKQYEKGTLVLSRLCPVDYHRYHFPCSGLPSETELINGALYSVNPIALRQRLSIFWENKRYLTLVDTESLGQVAILEIGATCVGSAVQTYTGGKQVTMGAEKGYFKFGGSSVITLFEPGRVTLSEDLKKYSEDGIELYARMGDVMGLAS